MKQDWKPSTTLTDVLITIRCLLIYPNPTSSLNAEAGQLLQEDYEGYTRHAKVMTGVHAVVPEELEALANEAKMRGEDEESVSTKAAVMKAKDADPKAPTEKRRVKQTVKPSSTKRHEDVKASAVRTTPIPMAIRGRRTKRLESHRLHVLGLRLVNVLAQRTILGYLPSKPW